MDHSICKRYYGVFFQKAISRPSMLNGENATCLAACLDATVTLLHHQQHKQMMFKCLLLHTLSLSIIFLFETISISLINSFNFRYFTSKKKKTYPPAINGHYKSETFSSEASRLPLSSPIFTILSTKLGNCFVLISASESSLFLNFTIRKEMNVAIP